MPAYTEIGYAVADIAALKAIAPSDRPAFAGALAYVVSTNQWFEFLPSGSSGGITPNSGSGRWYALHRETLLANRTYFVRTDGSDNNDGLANTSGGAFLTIQKFFDVLATIDKNGFDITCQVADGTYILSSSINVKDGIGDGLVTLRGNTTTPSNCLISSSANITYFRKFTNSTFVIEGFRFVNTGSNNNTIFLGLYAGLTRFRLLDFGATTSGAIAAQWNIVLDFTASVIPFGNFTISGNARAHALLSGNGVYRDDFSTNPPGTTITVTLSGTPSFSQYLDAYGSSVYAMDFNRQIFSGSAIGSRYFLTDQALISTGGGGASYLPGNSAGVILNGGQYV